MPANDRPRCTWESCFLLLSADSMLKALTLNLKAIVIDHLIHIHKVRYKALAHVPFAPAAALGLLLGQLRADIGQLLPQWLKLQAIDPFGFAIQRLALLQQRTALKRQWQNVSTPYSSQSAVQAPPFCR